MAGDFDAGDGYGLFGVRIHRGGRDPKVRVTVAVSIGSCRQLDKRALSPRVGERCET